MGTNNQIIQASSVKPTTQQLTYLPLPVAQGALLLTVRVRVITVASQSPPQAMSTAMAWMI
jgi:hypothetical protein